MVRNLRWMLGPTTGMLVLVGGGCHSCRQGAVSQPPPGALIIPAAPVPAPSQAVPGPPPGAVGNPNIRGYPPYQVQQPQVTLQQSPQQQPTWQPAGPSARLGTPQFDSTEPPPAAARGQTSDSPVMPGATDRPSVTPSLPVGIPRFNKVNDQVAAGLRPFDDGYDWLKENGYRTVLQLRAPGLDDTAERQQAEKRGLRYLSLEVSADTLGKRTVDEFARLVDDKTNQPLFVFDRDNVLAGALWYLYFRVPAQLPEATAREKAAQLGFKDSGSDEQKLLWLAIQKYLSEQGN